jgi:23S rRNA (guanosine2251-2'-O)-methyltransferase
MAGSLVSGVRAVAEALEQPRSVNRLYVAKETHAKAANELLARAKANGIPVDYVPQAKLNDLTETRDHQGIAAAISPIAYTPLETCLAQCTPRSVLLALDQVQHPKNLGMIVRSAAGAGASAVIVPSRGSAMLDATVVRASAGTIFRVPIVAVSNLSQALRACKDAGMWVYGLDGAAPQSIYNVEWPDRVVLVAGNESEGIRPGLRKVCDEMLRIPLAEGVESLNVAVAVSVALFEVARCVNAKS